MSFEMETNYFKLEGLRRYEPSIFKDIKKYGKKMGWKKPYKEISEKEKDLEQIDLMEIIEPYSEEDKKILLNNLHSLQLTEGCSGNCPFCFKGKPKKPEAEFTSESIENFFSKYDEYLDDKKFLSLYGQSDPMDRKDFYQIYKIAKKYKPKMDFSLSTSIPEGGENNFINFIKNSFKNNEKFVFRISLSQYNYFRTEKSLNKLISELKFEGYNKKSIAIFLDENVVIEPKFGEYIHQLGDNFKKENGSKNNISPVCTDGIIITPRGIFGTLMVAPTEYDPTGERTFEIETEDVLKQTPRFCYRDSYFGFFERDCLIERTKMDCFILPPALTTKMEHYNYNNRLENVCLWLSRESFALGLNVAELSTLTYIKSVYKYSEKEINNYLNGLTSEFKERIKFTDKIMKRADEVSKEGLAFASLERLNYYRDLTSLILLKMTILLNLIETEPEKIDLWSDLAYNFLKISLEDKEKLREIVDHFKTKNI